MALFKNFADVTAADLEFTNIVSTIRETLKDEEQEKYDNLPDSLQDSERGETFTDNVDNMETAYDSLDEAIGYLQEILDR